MTIKNHQLIYMVAISGIAASVFFVHPVNAQCEYTKEDLYTIPWGDTPGSLLTGWHIPPDSPEYTGLIDPPGPFAVSSEGEMVINNGGLLMKFSPEGELTASVVLRSLGLEQPFSLAINSVGQVLIDNYRWDHRLGGYTTTLRLFDSSLRPVNEASIPSGLETMPSWQSIFPSNVGSFWVIYETSNRPIRDYRDPLYYERELIEYSLDASISPPQLLYAGENSDPGPGQTRFVTPSGELRPHIEDVYGCTYTDEGEDLVLSRFSPDGELVYSFDYRSDPAWRRFVAGSPKWFVTWAGDMYILRATDEGAVLTKYTLITE